MSISGFKKIIFYQMTNRVLKEDTFIIKNTCSYNIEILIMNTQFYMNDLVMI